MKDTGLHTGIGSGSLPAFLEDRLSKTLAVDFEAVPDGTLFHIGAVLNGRTFEEKDIKSPQAALERLSAFGADASHILGHNIIRHDLALVKKLLPQSGLLSLKPVDTLLLSPLAFPENPYHRLVKDYKLVTASKNDPVTDARLALTLFEDQTAAFLRLSQILPGMMTFFAFVFDLPGNQGISDLFAEIGGSRPEPGRAKAFFMEICTGRVCPEAAREVWASLNSDPEKKPLLAYLISWLRVAGGNSVLPPWVRHEFPEIPELIQKLRYNCSKPDCPWCQEHSNPEKLLKHYFGFDQYRTLPDGTPLQRDIIQAALGGKTHLGILPTGGGKSIFYQIPALYRFHRTGGLTIVISPLKALMKDQVDNLNRAIGMECAAAINGSLTLPERGAVMEKVRLGDIGILYLSPEQLRNFGIVSLIQTREVVCWIFDEAHCLSKWGHDFRPDYLHVADLIADQHGRTGRLPVVGAFTATAKKDVVLEICSHFKEKLGIEPDLFMGGVDRTNLTFQVLPVTAEEKYDVIAATLKDSPGEGGAIVYCATRNGTETLSRFLSDQGIPAQAFHAGRSEPDKRNIQDDFIAGTIPVICATNAFGMGIDKKDIRLVIHADIPGSLENYLQEAGRAGRDLEPSDCILLYESGDIDHQFSMNAYSKLSLKDIKKILNVLKKRGAKTPEIVITPGEIMRLIGRSDFGTNDGPARIGVAWLERRGFLQRNLNQTLFFTGMPLVKNLEEARGKITALNLSKTREAVFHSLLATLFNAEKDALISADLLCEGLCHIENLPEAYLDPREVMAVLSDMARAGLIREGAVMTAFVQPKGKESALKLLALFSGMETAMADLMTELSPESSADTPDLINLRRVAQRLKDRGFETATPDVVGTLLRTMAGDRGDTGGKSLKIAGKKGAEQQWVRVHIPWQEVRQRMDLRHKCAAVCLETMIQSLPAQLRAGQAQVLVRFFISDIIRAMEEDLFLSGFRGDSRQLVESSLLFLHDTKAITLQNGLGVFRQAMTLTLDRERAKQGYNKADYEPLSLHYDQKNVQVHVMEKYAQLGLEKIKTALTFVRDYFEATHDSFIRRYFPGQTKIITTAMTARAYTDIIQSLKNPAQESIVAASPEKNLLVLAGPGSGKTRTIVHRCAWLIKAKSVNPESILVLCFNHRTMIKLRQKIRSLAGNAAAQVTAMTFHGLAMRLTGRSLMDFTHQRQGSPELSFDQYIEEAIAILEGRIKLPGVDEAREFLTAQYRYILVDEYQDIDDRQYRFITALTGRMEADVDAKIAIMAVGDDDQSIYGFRDANVRYIRRFKEDFRAETVFLMENYRSSHPIIEAANSLIHLNQTRMKTGEPGRINASRKALALPPEKTPDESRVGLTIFPDLASQAVFVADRIEDLLKSPGTQAEDIAVVARQGIAYPALVALRMALAGKGIPLSYSLKSGPGFPIFRIREFQNFLNVLKTRRKESLTADDLKKEVMEALPDNNGWAAQVVRILEDWQRLIGDMAVSVARAEEFALSCLLEEKQAHRTGTGIFAGTVHSVKGLEFPHVFILDHGWTTGDLEEERRLYYVGMTRAMKSLILCHITGSGNPHVKALTDHPFVCRIKAPMAPIKGFSEDLTITVMGMEDLFISYPARFPATHPIHDRLSRIRTGDRVNLAQSGPYIRILDSDGNPVAALSQSAVQNWQNRLDRIVSARVLGMVARFADDGENPVEDGAGPEEWLLPIVEILHRKTPKRLTE